MNTAIILYVSLLILFCIHPSLSYPGSRFNMYKAIPKLIAAEDKDSESPESKEDFVRERSWDSGEDHYFRWAPTNRRPMESLVGKKREDKRVPRRTNERRIKSGLWRSGLVG